MGVRQLHNLRLQQNRLWQSRRNIENKKKEIYKTDCDVTANIWTYKIRVLLYHCNIFERRDYRVLLHFLVY